MFLMYVLYNTQEVDVNKFVIQVYLGKEVVDFSFITIEILLNGEL